MRYNRGSRDLRHHPRYPAPEAGASCGVLEVRMRRAPLPHGPRTPILVFRAALALAAALVLATAAAGRATAAPPCARTAGQSAWAFLWTPTWLPGVPQAAGTALQGDAATAGLWIALDPVTRRPVRPTPEQRSAAGLAAPEVDEVLPVERIPGGGELLHLNGRHQVFEVARRDATGRFRTSCASDSATATRVLATPVSAREAK